MGGDRANANWHADVFAGIQWSKSVNGMIRNCVRRVNAVDCEYISMWKWSDSWFSFRLFLWNSRLKKYFKQSQLLIPLPDESGREL